jgi:hypothetical protein
LQIPSFASSPLIAQFVKSAKKSLGGEAKLANNHDKTKKSNHYGRKENIRILDALAGTAPGRKLSKSTTTRSRERQRPPVPSAQTSLWSNKKKGLDPIH